MTTGAPLLKALLIYGICLPIAIIIGMLLGNGPLDAEFLYFTTLVLVVISIPVLLKWHHPFLLLSWNMSAVVFLVPGRPMLWLMVALSSLGISILQRTLITGMKWLPSASVAAPLLFMAAVTMFTALMTGGIGFHVLGSETFGGRRYLDVFGAIAAYFALTAHRVPPRRVYIYCAFFFLGSITAAVSSLAQVITNPAFYYVFLFFPPEAIPGAGAGSDIGMVRFGGAGLACAGVIYYLIARHGLRGIFLAGKPIRLFLFTGFFVLSLIGGFRSMLIGLVLLLAIEFWVEGLTKTKLLPISLVIGLVGSIALFPFIQKLPYTFQRAIAFLPVDVDPVVRADAQSSTEWRVNMWKEALPEIPKHLLLGTGYAIEASELMRTEAVKNTEAVTSSSLLTGNYHNGPLSVILAFGIWGAIGFLWFLWAAGRGLYFNYKYGEPQLTQVNRFLFVLFLSQVVVFFLVFGALWVDFFKFTGLIGFSVALNGGICRPVAAVVPVRRPNRPIPLVLRRREPVLSKTA